MIFTGSIWINGNLASMKFLRRQGNYRLVTYVYTKYVVATDHMIVYGVSGECETSCDVPENIMFTTTTMEISVDLHVLF